jgi:hypothetical protein
MNSKKELQYAYGLAILFFVVGVLSYAAFSQKPPERPVRVMFHSIAGKVLFDHKTHLADTGYGVSCVDCHHHPGEDETQSTACLDCHKPKGAEKEENQTCLECHGADEIEDTELPNRSDAFHTQCIGCHQEFEAGPRECSSCHVL